MKYDCPRCKEGYLSAFFKDGKWVIECIGFYAKTPCGFKISLEDRRKQKLEIDFEERREKNNN